jgi:arginase
LLTRVLSERKFPLVIGGDCSILLGAALALKSRGNFALFYLDGHTDFMEPELSQTGGLGGMAAAVVAGRGHEKLVNINGLYPYVQEKYVWCVGNREYDEEYERSIINSKARYVSLARLRETGISTCVNSFLDMVAKENLDGFWLHIDVDVLDDALMPAVDSRTPGGLSYDEFNKIVVILLSSAKATGAEITILDPDLDPSGKYTEEFVQNFTHTFKEARMRLHGNGG